MSCSDGTRTFSFDHAHSNKLDVFLFSAIAGTGDLLSKHALGII